MQKIIILQGLPGSGKTTYALEFLKHNKNFIRINRDSIREQLGREYSNGFEKVVKGIRDHSIATGLQGGYSIVVDDVNLDQSNIEQIIKIRNEIDPTIGMEVKEFNVPLEECLARNERRVNKVPAKVIVEMYKKYIKPQLPDQQHPVYYPHKEGLTYVYQWDIDGTLALKGDRHIYDYEKVHLDLPHLPVVDLYKKLSLYHPSIVMSGREDSCRKQTEQWLRDNGIIHIGLFMRKAGDHRNDSIIKRELWEEHVKDKYNVLTVFEDRARVVDTWRSIGLFCCQVAEGNF